MVNENTLKINSAYQNWKVGAGVTAIRRRSQHALKLEPQLALIEGDVVVLIGTAAAVTAGEDVLLRGR